MTEIWKAVVGFEGAYEVSNLGRVQSLDRSWPQLSRHGTIYTHFKKGQMLRPGRMPGGHVSVALGRGNSRCVHELVLNAFVGPCPPGQEARHLNGVPNDNVLPNLKWDTKGNNRRDKKWHNSARNYKLSPAEVAEIKQRLRKNYRGLGRVLAVIFGVSASTISCIKHEKVHSDV